VRTKGRSAEIGEKDLSTQQDFERRVEGKKKSLAKAKDFL
jgi:hypothetical protein